MVWWVRHLPCKHEAPSSNLRAHAKPEECLPSQCWDGKQTGEPQKLTGQVGWNMQAVPQKRDQKGRRGQPIGRLIHFICK